MKLGTFQLMKSVNKSVVLNKIRTGEPISRAQIAKETKLTPPTVGAIVRELLDENLVIETNDGESMGGRRPIMIRINDQAFSILGIDAGPEQIVGIVSDLAGNILKRESVRFNWPIDKETFLASLKKCLRRLKEDPPKGAGEFLGVGVAMHGVVDVERGISLIAPNLNLCDIPIKEELEKEFDLPIKVENDARLMALGELWFGGHGKLHSLIAVNLGRGVGGGMIIDGNLYHGERDLAGEVGHMIIDIHGKICECGNRGCLQTLASGPAIAERAKQSGEDGFLADLTGEDVYNLAKTGNKLCQEILKQTGEYIGVGLTNLIHIVNPQKIVLGGGVMNSAEYILPQIDKTVRERGLTKEAKQTEIVLTKLGTDATLLGAISLFLVELFK